MKESKRKCPRKDNEQLSPELAMNSKESCKTNSIVSTHNLEKSKEQRVDVDKGKKTVKELVEILETRLDQSNINNIKYCEQDFHFQRETMLFLKKNKNNKSKQIEKELRYF